ncbi:MAG: hypothetical protein K2L48_00610 [Mycoplasmoidaceae bacterium]|nr:hypothetical protein [Mycoplasmoidaceae bacterium]
MEINKNLNKLASLLLAKSIKDLYPDALLGESKINEDGFAYSFKFNEKNVGANDFNKIKKQMQKNIDRAYEIKYELMSKNELLKVFANDKYKCELVNDSKDDSISVCKFGNDFIDLCENLGIEKLSNIKAIDLVNVSGYY